MNRDTLWLPPPPPRVYTTHDAAGRPHVCPAALRLATDAVFAARVAERTAARQTNIARDCCALDSCGVSGGKPGRAE